MNHQTSTVPQVTLQVAYQSPQALTQLMTESPFVDSGFVVPVFSLRDDLIACLNKAMAFLTVVASSRVTVQQVQGRQGKNYSGTTYKGNATSSRGNTTSGQARAVKCYNCQGAQKAEQILDEEQLVFLVDPGIPAGQAQTIIAHNAAFQTQDLNTYDSDCDDLSNAQAVLMANIFNYGFDVISKLERYKERVKTFEQRLNIDLSSREKMIDSQMDDMIKEKLALKEKVDSLEQNLSKQIKENECLLETFNVFQNKFKEKENKYMENEIDLKKKIKELNNIVFEVGQSAQTVHMLTKPQSFYDNIHKQALGYKNSFYLKKAQRIKPTLYDGIVISEKHVAMHVIDDEETLILEEESRSNMSKKAKDPEVIAKKISHKPIDYEKLNRLTNDFGKRFTLQQELSVEQAFWLRMSNPTIESSLLPVRMEVPMSMQFKQEVFQNDESCGYQNAPEIPEYFKNNDLKAQLKDKDTTICKLKDTIKSLRKNNKEEIVDHDRCDLATINEELENGVAKLLSKNERLCKEINHVKQVFRDQFDSIKQTCVLQRNRMTL
nr:hypothetical protein [Tanacetum cinerariifolium]